MFGTKNPTLKQTFVIANYKQQFSRRLQLLPYNYIIMLWVLDYCNLLNDKFRSKFETCHTLVGNYKTFGSDFSTDRKYISQPSYESSFIGIRTQYFRSVSSVLKIALSKSHFNIFVTNTSLLKQLWLSKSQNCYLWVMTEIIPHKSHIGAIKYNADTLWYNVSSKLTQNVKTLASSKVPLIWCAPSLSLYSF